MLSKETEFLYMTLVVEDFPKGFPRLACFLDSDNSFLVYRRFGTVFSRLLLNKQDEMREMEEVLLVMDKIDDGPENSVYLKSRTEDVRRGNIPHGLLGSRPQMMEKLEKKALEYGQSRL